MRRERTSSWRRLVTDALPAQPLSNGYFLKVAMRAGPTNGPLRCAQREGSEQDKSQQDTSQTTGHFPPLAESGLSSSVFVTNSEEGRRRPNTHKFTTTRPGWSFNKPNKPTSVHAMANIGGTAPRAKHKAPSCERRPSVADRRQVL